MEKRELPLAIGTDVEPQAVRLTETEDKIRRAAFHSIRSGRAPDAAELAGATGLELPSVNEAVGSAARKGRVVLDDSGRVVGSHGLSLVPARHRLRLGEDQFHTWCAIDAIGIPAALGADAVATTACPVCGRSMEIWFREGRASDDAEIRLWVPSKEGCTNVVEEYCPEANLFCSEEHLQLWRRRAGDPPGTVMTLEEGEDLGRTWWGDVA